MSLDKATVRSIAELARIEVPEEELDHLAGELSNILTFVEQLAAVDTDGVQPMTGALRAPNVGSAGEAGGVAAMTLPMRADQVSDGGQADKVLANAPEPMEGFFTVPKVVE